MAEGYDNLVREVAEQRTANASIITLVGNVKQRLDEIIAGGGTVADSALQALADELEAGQVEIAAAVTANTPVETAEAASAARNSPNAYPATPNSGLPGSEVVGATKDPNDHSKSSETGFTSSNKGA